MLAAAKFLVGQVDFLMISLILVTLDGSDASERALGPAREIADRFGATLSLLTVMIRYPESRIHIPQMDERVRKAAGRI
jgi:nucleotide-binding universal stress UspA family protein